MKTLLKQLSTLTTMLETIAMTGTSDFAIAPAPVKKSKLKADPVSDGGYVTLNGYFRLETGLYELLKRNVLKAQNTLLLGPTGVGKTELVSAIANHLDLPLTIFDMGTMSDPIMSLVGTHTIKVKDGQTNSEFARSRFSEAIQQPGIILLDELSRASATANNLLFPCLDFRRELAMEYCFDDCEPVKVHPECVFIATANLGSQYTGTHKLDRALIDRFMVLEIDPISNAQLKATIKSYRPTLTDAKVNTIMKCYHAINQAHDEFKISFNLSMRHLKMIADLVSDGFTIYDGFYAICKGIGGKDGMKALEAILNVAKTVV